jgi:hypothetical protein
MDFFLGRLLTKNGMVIAEHVEIWINTSHCEMQDYWDGTFVAPVVPALRAPASHLQRADRREGTMATITTRISGENVTVSCQASSPRMAGA